MDKHHSVILLGVHTVIATKLLVVLHGPAAIYNSTYSWLLWRDSWIKYGKHTVIAACGWHILQFLQQNIICFHTLNYLASVSLYVLITLQIKIGAVEFICITSSTFLSTELTILQASLHFWFSKILPHDGGYHSKL